MSARYVALHRYDPVKDPTARMRLEYDPDWSNAVLSDEDVHVSHVEDPNARVRSVLFSVQLTTACVKWLHEKTGELLPIMERNDTEVQAELGAPTGFPNPNQKERQ